MTIKGVAWDMDPSKTLNSTNETLPVYEGTVRITREIQVKPGIKANDDSVFKRFCALCVDPAAHLKASGVFHFQACDETRCYPPQAVPLQWSFHFLMPDRQRSSPDLRREFEPQQ